MKTGQQNSSPLYSEILQRLDAVRRKENRLSLLYGSLATILVTISIVLPGILLEEIFSLGVAERTVLFVAVLLCIGGCAGWFVLRPLLRSFGFLKIDTEMSIALKVGVHFPSIRDRLVDALQIYEARNTLQQIYSSALIDASFTDLCQQIQPLDFTGAVSDTRVKRFRKFVTYAFGVFLLVFVVSPSGFLGSIYRIANYNTSYAVTQEIRFVVEPGNTEIVRGESVPVTVRVLGASRRKLSLMMRPEGQLEFDAQVLQAGTDGTFHTELGSLKSTTEYFVSVEENKSDKFKITVVDRPLVRSFQLKVTLPSYTRLSPRLLDENVGDVSAYPGSRVDVQLTASEELSEASMVFNDSTMVPLKCGEARAVGSIGIKRDRTYHFQIVGRNGLANIFPVEYTIKALPDEYPTAEILAPAKNVELTEEMKLNLFIRIKDDFGFSQLRLAYKLVQSRYEQPDTAATYVNIPLARNDQIVMEVPYAWDLSSMHLVPEDAVSYYVEVFDNDEVNGPKAGKSETYLLRLPSLEEVFSDVSHDQVQSMESMKNVARQAEELKHDVEDLQRELKKQNREKLDWQQQNKAEQMLQQYESMKKKLEDASQKLDESVKKMEENKVLSDETLEKYLELQKLMDQLKSPELQEALKKLRESTKQLSPEQMKQATEQLKFSEEQFRQSLERTIELLKRIAIEQKIDELLKRAEELKKQQEALKQQASKTNPSDEQKRNDLARQQQGLQQQADSLQKETKDLKDKMDEFPKEMPLQEMSKAQQQLQNQQLQQKMNSAAQKMKAGDMQQAQEDQQQAMDGLNQFEEQMQEVKKALSDKQMKEVVNKMRKQIENILELSKREENLKNQTQSLEPNSRRFREAAEGQNEEINNLGNVANEMAELAKKSFAISPEMGKEIGNAMRQMGDAMQGLESRNPLGTSAKQGEAMGSLNRAAMMMQNALNGMMQGGEGGMTMAGLMGRLGQTAGAQGSINQGTQSAMGQGEGLTQQQMAEYQRLAGQQAAVQKSLEELSREAKNAGEYSRLLGDIDRVAQEMKEVQTDLEQNHVNPETIRKQDRILSRLLDSQRSVRERDYEKRRRAETGNSISHASPSDFDVTTQEGKNRLREELLKALEGKYSKDYEELIKKYFEQLEKEDQLH